MYAGTTFRKGSGALVGVHQKIDRVARRHFSKHIPKSSKFPNLKMILHFEGNNGPDGIKRKSPSVDEPWHLINPDDTNDRALLVLIDDHIFNLSTALREKNQIRAAFEAAWMAHAITDGLTPAHHYPLEDKIEELWGKTRHERTSIKDKNIIIGNGPRDTVAKNWEYWGAGGVITKHLEFEMGVATAIASDNFDDVDVSGEDIVLLNKYGFEYIYLDSIRKIHALKIYDEFVETGWTTKIASQIKDELIPEIVRMVMLAWLESVNKSKGEAE